MRLKVQEHVGSLVATHFGNDAEMVMRDPILFGDFRSALQEEETRVYEDIQDYEAAKALFQVFTGAHPSLSPAPVTAPGSHLAHSWGAPTTCWTPLSAPVRSAS